MTSKAAGETQVAWALLSEGVSQARLEAHRLRHLMTRALTLVERSEAKEHIYQEAGDILLTAPRRMEALERVLDRTSYALSLLGADHLRDRLPMSDRTLVDDATTQARPFGSTAPAAPRSSVVALRHLVRKDADLNPPLGEPGGVCHLIRRINDEVPNPRLRDDLIEDVERGLKLDNTAASKVYDLETDEGPGGKWKKLQVVPHAQYRMDQRGVSLKDVQEGLKGFMKVWNDERSRKSPLATRWETDLAYREPIYWTSKQRLALVFTSVSPDTVRLITTYWEGKPDPRPVPRDACPVG